MRRLLVIVAGLFLLAALPTTAAAAKPTRFTDHTVSLFCDGMTATSGGGFAFFSANTSDQFGPDAFIDFWDGSAPAGAPDIFRDFDQPVTVTWNGTTLSGSIPVIDTIGTTTSATFSATLTPVGDPFPFDDRFREGNRWHRFTGSSQPMDPNGTLTVGDSTFSLGACFADETTVTVFETNPNAFVNRFSERNLGCDLTNANGDTGFLFVNLDENDMFIDAGVDPAGAAPPISAFGFGSLTDGVLDATLETFDPETGEPVPGGGSIHLEIVGTGEPFRYVLRAATIRVMARGVALDIEGSLTVAGSTFDLGACVGVDGTTKEIITAPRGPKPGGKVPANDRPSGAKELTVGSRTSVATKGASPDREAPYECMTFEENGQTIEIPVGHTVWYRIVGTGGPITVDTAGSDYDTVAAVYTSNGSGGFTPVPGACVDDVPLDPVGRTLQAAVTWQSVAGTTYYVQIGGFPDSFTYGNLRVAVR